MVNDRGRCFHEYPPPPSLYLVHVRLNRSVYRLSGVRCPEIVDVPLPTAPVPPPHDQEDSPFSRPRESSSKGASNATVERKSGSSAADSKPMGQLIAPKAYFAVAAAAAAAVGGGGGGKRKGKAKGGKGEEGGGGGGGGEAKNGGNIDSFFGKGEKRESVHVCLVGKVCFIRGT